MSTILSAYSKMETLSLPISIPLQTALICATRSFRNKLKSTGDNEQPCLSPHFTSNHSVVRPFILGETDSYKDCITCMQLEILTHLLSMHNLL